MGKTLIHLGAVILLLIMLSLLSFNSCSHWKKEAKMWEEIAKNPVPSTEVITTDTVWQHTESVRTITKLVPVRTDIDSFKQADSIYTVERNTYIETVGDSLVNIEVTSYVTGILDSLTVKYDYKFPTITTTIERGYSYPVYINQGGIYGGAGLTYVDNIFYPSLHLDYVSGTNYAVSMFYIPDSRLRVKGIGGKVSLRLVPIKNKNK